MHVSLRNGTLALGLAAVICFAAWSFFVWTLASYHQGYRDSGEQQAHADTDTTDRELYDLCAGRLPGPTVECIRENIKANQETQRAKNDLKAQQQMADWAFLMVWVSGVTALITATGVIYVAANLVHQVVRVVPDSVYRRVGQQRGQLTGQPGLIRRRANQLKRDGLGTPVANDLETDGVFQG